MNSVIVRDPAFQMSAPVANHRPFRTKKPRVNCAMAVSLAWETWQHLGSDGFYEFIPAESEYSFVQQKQRLLVLLEEDLLLNPEPREPTKELQWLLEVELARRLQSGCRRPNGFGSRSSVTVSCGVREKLIRRCGLFKFSEHVVGILLGGVAKAGLLKMPERHPW